MSAKSRWLVVALFRGGDDTPHSVYSIRCSSRETALEIGRFLKNVGSNIDEEENSHFYGGIRIFEDPGGEDEVQ